MDLTDVSRITEGQANWKYALAGRFCQSGARYGINVCARGAIWDPGGNDCPAFMVSREKAIETGRGRAALNNLWLQ